MNDKTISIEEFLEIAGVKLETVIRHKDEIPGLLYCDGYFRIIEGTRYPCFYKNKMETFADRRYLLLRAISENKYIDNRKLKVYPAQFNGMLKDLLDADLIRENHMANHYGANAYDSTPKGDELLRLTKRKAINEIAALVAEFGGRFTGAVLSEVLPG